MNQYRDGTYWETHASFHEEDSDFKFRNFLTLLQRNAQVQPKGVVDIGCGAGRIAWNFAKAYPQIPCMGVDLDEGIIAYASGKYSASNLFFTTDPIAANQNIPYDTAVLADVFEHVEDYAGFLRDISARYRYQLFNIPLDISVRTIVRGGILHSRKTFGHLHYFYDKLAIRVLNDNGFHVMDYLYADNIGFEYRNAKGRSKPGTWFKMAFARLCSALIGKSRTAILLGCYSLTVLCSSKQEAV